jgi:hypothetical protein
MVTGHVSKKAFRNNGAQICNKKPSRRYMINWIGYHPKAHNINVNNTHTII